MRTLENEAGLTRKPGFGTTLVTNAVLVNPGLPPTVVERGWLAFAGERITALGPHEPPVELLHGAHVVVDGCGGILMPGLVNAHTHAAMSLLRGLADDLPLKEWLEGHIFPAEAKAVDEDFVYWGTLLACGEMILSGTTTFADGYFYEDSAMEAARSSGMRAVLAQGVLDFPVPGCPDPSFNIENAIGFLNRSWGEEPLRPAIFCHSPYTCSAETLQKAKEACRVHHALFFIHVAETKEELALVEAKYGLSPLKHLAKLGLLDKETVLVHGVWLGDSDIEVLADSGAALVICTESNMKLASGIAPLTKLLAKQVTLGLGTDGAASNNDLDLFSEMDLTAKLHKLAHLDPTVVKAADVLYMATRGGALSLGLQEVGLLEPGFQADLILLATDRPHMQPLYNPVSQLVYSAKGSDVERVWVRGQELLRRRCLLNMDIQEIKKWARRLAKRVQPNRAIQSALP
ncbi:MAG: amidohydrolase [bacterium]